MANVEYRRPTLYPKQLAAIFCAARVAIIEATTKAGKTFGALAWLVEQGLGSKWRNHWWVAPTYAQAKIVYRRLKAGIPRQLYTFNDTELTITLGAKTFWFKGGDRPDSLYGDDVGSAVIDEGSRCKEEAFHAVRSTLTATQGRLVIIGNVHGRRNWFYQLARKAEAGAPDMHYAKLTALDAIEGGIFPPEELENARQLLPPAVFRELYMAEASEDGGNPFGLEAIRACISEMSTQPIVAWGADLAKSVDFTAVIGLDGAGRVAAFDHYQKPWQETLAHLTDRLKLGPTFMDSTGVGDPIVEQLQRTGVDKLTGVKFTQQSKQQLMEGLAAAIQQRQVGFPDGPIRAELEAFEYEATRTGVRYSAPDGMHDDCVMALALAWAQYRDQRPAPTFGWTLPTAPEPKAVLDEDAQREADAELIAQTIRETGTFGGVTR